MTFTMIEIACAIFDAVFPKILHLSFFYYPDPR